MPLNFNVHMNQWCANKCLATGFLKKDLCEVFDDLCDSDILPCLI